MNTQMIVKLSNNDPGWIKSLFPLKHFYSILDKSARHFERSSRSQLANTSQVCGSHLLILYKIKKSILRIVYHEAPSKHVLETYATFNHLQISIDIPRSTPYWTLIVPWKLEISYDHQNHSNS